MGGREGGREEGREGGREREGEGGKERKGRREGGREGRKEGEVWKEGERELIHENLMQKKYHAIYTYMYIEHVCTCTLYVTRTHLHSMMDTYTCTVYKTYITT